MSAAPIATPPPTPTAAIEPPLAPITVPMYSEMLRAGILADQRVTLWNGRLAQRRTTGRPHTIAVTKAFVAFHELRIPGVFVEKGQLMALRLEHSAPCPDLKVVRGRLECFPVELVTSADVPLVVEVCDSSLATDRRQASTYAREGIPVYWIVDLIGRAVEVYSLVAAGTYGPPTRHGDQDRVPILIDGDEVGRLRVSDLLP